jgi:hypothetical protein
MKKTLVSVFVIFLFIGNNVSACTIVSCSLKGKVFAAANEDDYTSLARIWFNPGTSTRYGSVCFGLPDLQVQAAMNEYGLFFDFTAQYDIDPSKYHLKNPYNGDIFFEILGKCKNIKEALDFLSTHDYMFSSQALLADAEGNSVVINAGVKVIKKGNYQINTNFNICNVATGNYSCRRYDIANEMLSRATELSVPFFKAILDETHQEGKLSTIYSNIYDLKRGIIYVYLFHNFNNVYVIDLKKELRKGYRLENLAEHFPPYFSYETFVQSDSGYKKELIMSEIDNKGLESTITHYVSLTDTSSEIKLALIDVSLQLIRNSWNEHANGGMWEYWFSLPGGYLITQYKDKRLDAAAEILSYIMKQGKLDSKYRYFTYEIYAFINLVQGKNQIAKEYYEKAVSNPSETFAVSFNRAKEMLNRIKDN